MLTAHDVPWDIFRYFAGTDDEKFSAEWLLNPVNVVSQFRDGTYCRLCDSTFHGSPAEHVAGHAPSLEAWEAQRKAKPHDPELGAQVVEAVRLHVEEGLSQRQAAAKAGISRQRLKGALQSRAGAAPEVAHAEIEGSTRRGLGPPQTAPQGEVSGEEQEAA